MNNMHCINSGLPQSEREQLLENIHFLCCSNKVSPLELAKLLVESLLKLEEGICMYEAAVKEKVMIAPVIFIIADNPMASELCNHLGSAAVKYCRFCMVSLIVCFSWLHVEAYKKVRWTKIVLLRRLAQKLTQIQTTVIEQQQKCCNKEAIVKEVWASRTPKPALQITS